jgi:uncharacterized membrane protein
MSDREPRPTPPDPVAHNVELVADLHARAKRESTRHQRALAALGSSVGRPAVLYAILVGVASWMVLNVMMAQPLDPPPFFWMQGAVGLSALSATVLVLIAQNREARIAEQRDHLDLQVNLLAERKVAKLIELVEELRRDMPTVRDRRDAEAELLKQAADPGKVLDVIEGVAVEAERKRRE